MVRPNWKNELWKHCKTAYQKGGEVRVVFIHREALVIPIVYPPAPAPVQCEEEIVVCEED